MASLKQQRNTNNNNELIRYASLGTQLFVSLGLAVFLGLKADKWLKISAHLLIWLLPLVVLIGMLYKIVKDTSKPRDKNEKK
jgi:hypothetical protein